jgi:ankyrin repeat protein
MHTSQTHSHTHTHTHTHTLSLSLSLSLSHSRTHTQDAEGRTPLHWCAYNRTERQVRCLRALMKYGFGVGRGPEAEALRAHVSAVNAAVNAVNVHDKSGLTPLMCCAHAGNAEGVAALLKCGADRTIKVRACMHYHSHTNTCSLTLHRTRVGRLLSTMQQWAGGGAA